MSEEPTLADRLDTDAEIVGEYPDLSSAALLADQLAFDLSTAAEALREAEAELERTRQAWVNGDDPYCEDVCQIACKGPCGISDPWLEELRGDE